MEEVFEEAQGPHRAVKRLLLLIIQRSLCVYMVYMHLCICVCTHVCAHAHFYGHVDGCMHAWIIFILCLLLFYTFLCM
jgi:hypothetical protein